MTRLALAAVHAGGSLIAMQSGLSAAAMFDPNEATQGTIPGAFLAAAALTLLFAAGFHHLLLRAIAASYTTFPVAAAIDPSAAGGLLLRLSGDALATGARIAAPMILSGILVNLGPGRHGSHGAVLPDLLPGIAGAATPGAGGARAIAASGHGAVRRGFRPWRRLAGAARLTMAEEQDDGQKTEAPSQRRLDEARAKGQLVVSREVHTLLLFTRQRRCGSRRSRGGAGRRHGRTRLSGATASVADRRPRARAAAGRAAGRDRPGAAPAVPRTDGSTDRERAAAERRGLDRQPLQPKLERISPLAGAKRLFSGRSLFEFGKSLAKLALVGTALALLLWPEAPGIVAASRLEAGPFLGYLADLIGRTLTLLAPWPWPWWPPPTTATSICSSCGRCGCRGARCRTSTSRADGDPHVKQRFRALRQERARRRMIADVPKSTVVITNPTHVAVALRYVAGETAAPQVLAKGVDTLALKIREIAAANGIPVIENPPLARALHAGCNVGDLVPPAHYQAVRRSSPTCCASAIGADAGYAGVRRGDRAATAKSSFTLPVQSRPHANTSGSAKCRPSLEWDRSAARIRHHHAGQITATLAAEFGDLSLVGVEAQAIADDALPSPDLALHARPHIVAAVFLPSHSASRLDRLDVPVALGGRGLRSLTERRIPARRHDHRSLRMALVHIGVDAASIKSSVTREQGHGMRPGRAEARLGWRHRHHDRSAWRPRSGRWSRPCRYAEPATTAAF